MADSFTRDMFLWLNQVAADTRLPMSCFKAAYLVAQHINRKTRTAWPSQTTLAAAMAISERAVGAAIGHLVKCGHLKVKVTRAPGRANEYAILLKDRKQTSGNDTQEDRKPASGNGDSRPEAQRSKTGSLAQEDRKQTSSKTGSTLPPNHLNEPSEEPSEEPFERRARKKPRSSLPSNWPSEKDKEWAIEHWRKAGRHGLVDRIESEAAKARDHHLAKGTKAADWSAVFRTWAQRSIEFEKPQYAVDRPRTGAASAAYGIDAVLRPDQE